jgi:hypothetical protein
MKESRNKDGKKGNIKGRRDNKSHRNIYGRKL